MKPILDHIVYTCHLCFYLGSLNRFVYFPLADEKSLKSPLSQTQHALLQTQHAPNTVADRLFVLIPTLAPHLGGLDVGGALVVGLS